MPWPVPHLGWVHAGVLLQVCLWSGCVQFPLFRCCDRPLSSPWRFCSCSKSVRSCPVSVCRTWPVVPHGPLVCCTVVVRKREQRGPSSTSVAPACVAEPLAGPQDLLQDVLMRPVAGQRHADVTSLVAFLSFPSREHQGCTGELEVLLGGCWWHK